MTVCTCPPANRDAVIRRRFEKGRNTRRGQERVGVELHRRRPRSIDTRGITAVVCAGDPARAGRGDAPPR